MQALPILSTPTIATLSQRRTSTLLQPSWKRYFFWALLALFTVSFSQPIAATTEPCFPLLADGGLEDGREWQAKNSDGFPLLSRQLVHSGAQGAYLGGRNNVADRLSTTLHLPATGQTITLRFWWQLQSQESATTGGDQLSVLAANKQGLPLQSLVELRGRDVAHEWQSMSIDLTHFAGQNIQLQFLASTDAEQITDFFIDDVEIVACGTANQK